MHWLEEEGGADPVYSKQAAKQTAAAAATATADTAATAAVFVRRPSSGSIVPPLTSFDWNDVDPKQLLLLLPLLLCTDQAAGVLCPSDFV